METRKAEIARLAGIAFDKRERYVRLGFMNATAGTEAERRERSIEYKLAESDSFDALKALKKAIEEGE